jgi:hypothetical protein
MEGAKMIDWHSDTTAPWHIVHAGVRYGLAARSYAFDDTRQWLEKNMDVLPHFVLVQLVKDIEGQLEMLERRPMGADYDPEAHHVTALEKLHTLAVERHGKTLLDILTQRGLEAFSVWNG